MDHFFYEIEKNEPKIKATERSLKVLLLILLCKQQGSGVPQPQALPM